MSRTVFLLQEYYLQMVLNKFDINKSTKSFTTLLPSNSKLSSTWSLCTDNKWELWFKTHILMMLVV